ncbi:MAG: hypothetical protein K2I48_08390 [Muribaculaceae bacterium]|nr:hypothetical protein [Muribaculaceae bacterium]
MNLKKILLCSALLTGAITASAITPFAEFQPIQVGYEWTAFNLQGGFTCKITDNISLGAGLGATQDWTFQTSPLIPVFGRFDASGKIKDFNTFFTFDLGYELYTYDPCIPIILVNPMVGLKFNKWYGGIGYLGHCLTSKGYINCFNMKIGYTF